MHKDPISNTVPKDWSAEEEILAKEALRVLYREYPRWKWGIEFTPSTAESIGSMVIRLLDVPTKTVYIVNPNDIDKDRMRCVMRGGGLLLEAHGLRVGGARRDDIIRGLRKTPAGLIVPDYNAMPENNPGYTETKAQTLLLR